MKRALLVARREFVENARTRGFWLGMLALPVMLAASVGFQIFFAKVKDVRRYAVLDQSGWLLPLVDKYAETSDLERLLRTARHHAQQDAVAGLPSVLQPFAPVVRDASDAALDALARRMAGTSDAASDMDLTPTLSAAADESGKALVAWYQGLSVAAARKADHDLGRSRFQRVEVPAGTADAEAWARAQMALKPPQLFAYIVIGADPVKGSDGCKYVSENASDEELRGWFAEQASRGVRPRRLEQASVLPETLRRIDASLEFEARQVGKEGAEARVSSQDRARQFAPMIFVYLLWMAVLVNASMLLTNMIEEKSNRTIEVLLSSVSPLELMTGKVLGSAFTGMTVILSWLFWFVAAFALLPRFIEIPTSLDLAAIATDPRFLVSFAVYFLGGFLLYAAILVSIGAVCNSLKEAQSYMQPITLLLAVPLFAMAAVMQDPNGHVAKVLSYIPLFTPFVMMNRAAGPPEWWEYVTTSILLIASLCAMFWASAKIFRIGILMTGKPPSLREILGWLRAPVGSLPERRE